jgi:large subunit ribosomal protein L24
MSKQIKKGNTVKVISGDDKGKQGAVLEVNRKKSLIKIEGVNLVTRHYKARQANEKSQIKIFEKFIHISNVALISAT